MPRLFLPLLFIAGVPGDGVIRHLLAFRFLECLDVALRYRADRLRNNQSRFYMLSLNDHSITFLQGLDLAQYLVR